MSNLEMQVGTRGPSRVADLTDLLAPEDHVADADASLGSMSVTGDKIVTVIYLNHITIFGVGAGVGDNPSGSSQDWGPHLRVEIQAFMKGLSSSKGIDPPPKL